MQTLITQPVTGLRHKLTDRVTSSWARGHQEALNHYPHAAADARLQSCKGPGAMAWLRLCPYTKELTLSPSEFIFNVHHTLGRTHPNQSHLWPSRCLWCPHPGPVDPHGDHLFKCPGGFQRTHHHNALVSAFVCIGYEAKVDVKKEQLIRNYGVSLQQSTTKKRMDLVMRIPDEAQTFLDVTVTHLCHHNDPHRQENRANQTPGMALRKAEADKHWNYDVIARPASPLSRSPMRRSAGGLQRRRPFCTSWPRGCERITTRMTPACLPATSCPAGGISYRSRSRNTTPGCSSLRSTPTSSVTILAPSPQTRSGGGALSFPAKSPQSGVIG